MVFNIDKKKIDSIAVKDDAGLQLTYGDLSSYILSVKKVLPERELVFCLCDNRVGALAGFLSLYDNKDVCLLLSSHIDDALLSNLVSTYHPSYFWLPDNHHLCDQYKVVHTSLGFSLCKTEYEAPYLHPELSMLMTTSGTTGSPKLVRHKYGNVESNAKNVAKVFEWTTQERGIIDLPMQYTMGLNVICSHLYAGATVLLVSANLLSPKFWSFIKENKGTNFTGVPYSYEILTKLRFQKMNLPYLQTMAEGGGKMTNDFFYFFAEYAKKNGKRFFATFGTTETTARLAYLPPSEAMTHIGSIGHAIPEGRLTLIDDKGATISEEDKEGELKYEGPNVTMGYGKCIEDLQKGDEFKGVYYTGDIAKQDKDGFFYIIGRKKRFLKLFGLRVSLDQCERMIKDKFGFECACVGDDQKMIVYATDQCRLKEVKSLLMEKTGLVSKCFEIRFIESLPRFESGKINYSLLTDL